MVVNHQEDEEILPLVIVEFEEPNLLIFDYMYKLMSLVARLR